jgi:putative endopeptidase
MDVTVKPGDDFQRYAGGVWLKNNPVPAKESTWGSFTILRDFNVKAVREILKEAMADKQAAPGSVKRRVGDFYAAAMDSLTVDKAGFSPVKEDYVRAGSVQNTNQVLDEIVYLRTQGIAGPLFGFFVGQDRKHPNTMVAQLSQGGTSMPDRDYYLKEDARTKKIQAAYFTYLNTLFMLAGETEATAKQRAETVFRLEKKLAAAQMSRVEMRDPYKTYNKFLVSDFSKKTPAVDWSSMLVKLRAPGQDK